MSYLLSLLLGVAAGSIPFGMLLGLLAGKNLRAVGSGNIGATNALRALGPAGGIAVGLLDALKGFLPAFFAPALGLVPALVGAGAILGHVFSPWLGFRGGKGVATTIGTSLALFPLGFGAGLLLWIAVVFVTSYVSVASLTFALAMPVFVAAARLFHFPGGTWLNLGFFLAVAALVFWTHRVNIARLRQGKELRSQWRGK